MFVLYGHHRTDTLSGETLSLTVSYPDQEYLESIINNSADPLSQRLDGIVTSWNEGAEKIFGFQKRGHGKFLPFVPDIVREGRTGILHL